MIQGIYLFFDFHRVQLHVTWLLISSLEKVDPTVRCWPGSGSALESVIVIGRGCRDVCKSEVDILFEVFHNI